MHENASEPPVAQQDPGSRRSTQPEMRDLSTILWLTLPGLGPVVTSFSSESEVGARVGAELGAVVGISLTLVIIDSGSLSGAMDGALAACMMLAAKSSKLMRRSWRGLGAEMQ